MTDQLKRLNIAKKLVLEVRDTLSNEKAICECCGMTRWLDLDEYQMRELLNGVVNRILVVCESEAEAKSYKGDFGPMACYSYKGNLEDPNSPLTDEKFEWNWYPK